MPATPKTPPRTAQPLLHLSQVARHAAGRPAAPLLSSLCPSARQQQQPWPRPLAAWRRGLVGARGRAHWAAGWWQAGPPCKPCGGLTPPPPLPPPTAFCGQQLAVKQRAARPAAAAFTVRCARRHALQAGLQAGRSGALARPCPGAPQCMQPRRARRHAHGGWSDQRAPPPTTTTPLPPLTAPAARLLPPRAARATAATAPTSPSCRSSSATPTTAAARSGRLRACRRACCS